MNKRRSLREKETVKMNQKLAAKKEDSRKHCQDSANVHPAFTSFPSPALSVPRVLVTYLWSINRIVGLCLLGDHLFLFFGYMPDLVNGYLVSVSLFFHIFVVAVGSIITPVTLAHNSLIFPFYFVGPRVILYLSRNWFLAPTALFLSLFIPVGAGSYVHIYCPQILVFFSLYFSWIQDLEVINL